MNEKDDSEVVLEAGAAGHVHRFNAVRVPPEFGHSYLRCAYCGLSKHLVSHDDWTCDICTGVRADSAAPVVGDLLRDAGAILIVNEGVAGARIEIRFSALEDAQRLHKTLAQARAAAPLAAGEADELADEVQRRMDQVVEAAVEWHQSDDDWIETSERLGAAINSLLELRSKPTGPSAASSEKQT